MHAGSGLGSAGVRKGIRLDPRFPAVIQAEPQQGGDEQTLLVAVMAAAKLLLEAALDLKVTGTDHQAAIRDAGTVRLDRVRGGCGRGRRRRRSRGGDGRAHWPKEQNQGAAE